MLSRSALRAAALSLAILAGSGCETLSTVAAGCLENPASCASRLPSLSAGVPAFPDLATLGDAPEAITTHFGDARGETPSLDRFEPGRGDFVRLEGMPREADGTFRLLPGLYSLDARGYCLQPGTHGPSRGDGYLSAPLEGPRATVIRDILRAAPRHREVSQQQVQTLLWAIIARQSFSEMPPQEQRTVETLVPRHRFALDGGWAGLIPEAQMERIRSAAPEHLRRIYDAEARLRSALSSPRGGGYAALERIAMLPGPAPRQDEIRHVPAGRWSLHPDGYYVRYLPSGYTRMRFEVFVPQPGPLRLDRTGQPVFTNQTLGTATLAPVVFDATGHVVVPSSTSKQRLGSDGGPVGAEEPPWHATLPDCPCIPPHDGQPGRDRVGNRGHWSRENDASFRERYGLALAQIHVGAATAYRWSSESRAEGQQCTYDSGRRLITNGLGAGTPDLFSPDTDFLGHIENDVLPFGIFGRAQDPVCFQYLASAPPNPGSSCYANVRPERPIGTMYLMETCAQIVSILSNQ